MLQTRGELPPYIPGQSVQLFTVSNEPKRFRYMAEPSSKMNGDAFSSPQPRTVSFSHGPKIDSATNVLVLTCNGFPQSVYDGRGMTPAGVVPLVHSSRPTGNGVCNPSPMWYMTNFFFPPAVAAVGTWMTAGPCANLF